MAYELKFPEKIKKRIDSTKIIEQKAWSFIKELNSFDDEHLDALAIRNDYRNYSYRQMFRRFDMYAEVFSALGMTDENNSCVGILPGFSTEAIFSFYALNMTGAIVSMLHYLDFLETGRFDKMIEKEGITDLILCDRKIDVKLLEDVVSSKKRLGIRNIIVLHTSQKKTNGLNQMAEQHKIEYRMLKQVKGVLFMPDLLKKYEAMPIHYGKDALRDDALVMHTSGTTNGIHKPVPLSDRGINESAARLLRCEWFQKFKKPITTILSMEPTAAYGLMDMVHLPFSFGGCVVMLADGARGPQLLTYIKQYEINVLFTAPMAFDLLNKLPFKIDLSSLEFVFIGGAYLSAEKRKKCNSVLKKCGSDAKVSIGYGATEIGGAAILSSPERNDDSMGYPLPGIKVKIFDEKEEKFYNLEDGQRTGVLYLASPSVSNGVLNGIEFFELEEIDGDKYLNTFDLVRVNEDGSLNCIGRMNKFFVNNEGIRFDAGLIETAFSAEKGIEACGLVPKYDKLLHDTVPVLYVKTGNSGEKAKETIIDALIDVFISKNLLEDTNIPGILSICDNVPLNDAGKVDVYQIIQNNIKGEEYVIKPVRRGGKVVDFKIRPYEFGFGHIHTVPEELRNDAKAAKRFFKKMSNMNNHPGMGMPGMGASGMGMPCDFIPGEIDLQRLIQLIQNMAIQQGHIINQMYSSGNLVQPGNGYNFMPQGEFVQPYMGCVQIPRNCAGCTNNRMPQGGMGCANNMMPQGGMGCANSMMPQGGMGCANNMMPQGMGCANNQMSDMGYQQNPNAGGYNGGSMMNNPSITDILSKLFNASDFNKYYED
ncbi:AMP-binding protein [Butyrivibrio sp. WCE2006]|uniref:AMP-binding protein n=1 Tax=Butyrivibrio sp. WCE2006 TaxID=1410611 RepID=UPI0005D1B58F|nr:AMP-binding protein [Butyrivibrio sp. WCE2006]